MMRIEAPHPCDQPLRHPPGARILVHLEQPLMDARVHASGDESLDLQALAPQGMFIVSDAASVPERWRRQILHCVLGPREHVVPEELPLGQADPAEAGMLSSVG